MACMHGKTHIVLDQGTKDMAIELMMYMRRGTHILLELTAKDKTHIYGNHAHTLIDCYTFTFRQIMLKIQLT